MHDPLERNIWIIYVSGFLRGLVFFLPIFALYIQQELFTVLNVTLILSVGSFTALIFEIPSGAFADLFGRKRTLVIASILLIVALAFLSVGGRMMFFILYAIINGIAESLFSGTDTALLYDTLKNLGRKNTFKKVIAIVNMMWPAGATIGAIIGGVLAATSLQLPVALTLVPFTLAFLLTIFLVEPSYEKETHKNMFLQMQNAFKTIISNKQILLLSLTGFLLYSFGEVAHNLNPIFFQAKSIPVAIYGIIFAASFGLSSLGSISSHYLSDRFGDKKTLLVSAIIPPFLLFFATIVTGIWSAILIVIGSFFWGIDWPIISHLLNQETMSKQRATVISFGNLMKRLGFAIFAPFFGYIAGMYTIGTVFKLAAVLSLSVVGVLLMMKEH